MLSINFISLFNIFLDFIFTVTILFIIIALFSFTTLYLYDHVLGFNDLDTCFICGREYLPFSRSPTSTRFTKYSSILKKDIDGEPEDEDDEEEGDEARLKGSICGLCGAFIPH